MNDLEEEFQKLVNGMYREIQDKQDSGKITFSEAQELREMVNDRVQVSPRNAWNSSGCSIGDDYQPDDGWSPSQVCW